MPRAPGWASGLVALSLACTSCGYRPVYGGESGAALHVRVVGALVPDAVACDEVAAGARDELARASLLAGGDGFPRLAIEVLRADRTSEGIAAVAGQPVARGTDLALVGRAWVVADEGAAPERDTGDLRAQEVIAVDETMPAGAGAKATPDPRAASFHEADAIRAAARRLGRKLARRVIGLPAASEDEAERP